MKICPAWKTIRRQHVIDMYEAGVLLREICRIWSFGHNNSVLNLVSGRVSKMRGRGRRAG